MKHCPFIFLALVLAACESKQSPPADSATIDRAQTLMPTDTRLATLYAQSCKLCHAIPGSLAPLTSDRSAWAPRIEKGLPALKQSVIVGLNGMPPGGQCFSCTAEDYEALIRFMAEGKDE